MEEARIRDILRVLCRVAIPRGQLVLYKLALVSGDAGFKSNEVGKAIHYDGAQFRGLMAALATRINRSPRETYLTKKPGIDLMFVQTWSGAEFHHKPRPELFAAIERLPSLSSYLSKTMDEIVAGDWHRAPLPPNVPLAPPKIGISIPLPPKAPPFRQLLQGLDEGGLYFPGETVANVLLALQVKRFVILTGISGTGKTRIGQAVAARFPMMRKVAAPQAFDERAAPVTIAPYVHTRRRVVLPAALVALMPAVLQQQGAGMIKARWPGGTIELATYRNTALVMLFKGELRKWVDATFKLGDTLVLRLDGSTDGVPDTVVFEKPGATTVREERLVNSEIIAVRPDWTDNRGLLGFYNPLTRQYVTTAFLRILLAADEETRRATTEKRSPHPFFLLLDEMNLARVEHYFSDLLSAMESAGDESDPTAGTLHLHDELDLEEGETEDEGGAVPRRLKIPPNVFFLGTVNVDESTYMFSPKVLDRAFTIEFNGVDLAGLGKAIEDAGELELVRWDGTLRPPLRPDRADWRWLMEYRDGVLGKELSALHDLLAKANRHFGYRVACEIARFVHLAVDQVAAEESSASAAARAALDLAILQKVLVKLAGTQADLARVLDDLLWFTIAGAPVAEGARDLRKWALDAVEGEVVPADEASEEAPVFPRSAAKLWRMRQRMLERGFTSWIE
ncbi:MAG: hypothetical protein Q8P18_12205 [Pseudomonadota bacterium]|nr:hypothetical protein [Pseudomonadota bacterium]